MIQFIDVTKTFRHPGQPPRHALSSISLDIPSNRRIALVGEAQDERISLIDMLAGIALPTYGRIVRHCRVSFPVGFSGAFSPELSLRLNVAHVAKLYDVEPREVVDFVRQTADMGSMFERPFGELPNPVRIQVATIISFAIPFDVYLMKNDLSRIKFSPNSNFKAAAYSLFEARARSSGMIIAVSNANFAREYCDMGLVLHRGRMALFDDVQAAYDQLERLRFDDAISMPHPS